MKQAAVGKRKENKISLSDEALKLLESNRKSPEESYSDIVIRTIKSEDTVKPVKNPIRMSDAGFQSLVRREIEEAKQVGKDYYEGGEW